MARMLKPAGFVEPMLPTLVDAPPEGDEWLHEIKYDGYRTELWLSGKASHAFTRNGHDWTDRYETILRSAQRLRCKSALIDGEMCVQTATGLTDFGDLRRSIRTAPDRLVLFAFDLLALNGRDLRGDPLIDRRRRLQDLIGVEPTSRIHFSGEHVGGGPAFFRAAERHGLEGIVSKRADSRYGAGRTKAWLKVKSFTIGDFSVLGIERSATGIPVALLATAGRDAAYVGDATVILKPHERDAFWSSVERLGTPRARLRGALSRRKAAWIKEGLVARVRHLRGEDKLRHATIQSIGPATNEPGTIVESRHPDDE